METQVIRFEQITEPTPTYEAVAAEYAKFNADWDAATNVVDRVVVVSAWDKLQRRLATWGNLTDLRFNQDTSHADYKRAREYRDELRPKLTDLAIGLKRKLIASPHRAELERRFAPQAFALWEADVAAFDPRIQDDLVRESKLEAEYIDLLAAAKLEFQGATYNLSGLAKFRVDADRGVRYESNRVNWQWFADQRERLDRIYDDLVRLRSSMAQKLGFADFVGLGYKRMKRVDYGQAEVERFRAAVREDVVPLAVELRQQQAKSLGIERVMFWDEGVYEAQGNPQPAGDGHLPGCTLSRDT